MKKCILIISAGLLSLGGCKEIGPVIDFGHVASVDTTYLLTTSIPAADAHNVLVEEFTGQACSNCPAAHKNLENEAGKYAFGRVNVMGLYILNFGQTVPPTGSTYDLRDSIAWDISKSIYGGVPSLPSAGIDRTPVAGVLLQQGTGTWDGAIESMLTKQDSLNLLIQSNYLGAVATMTVTVTYTNAVAYAQNINIAVVEDSIKDFQEYPSGIAPYPSGYDTNYVFTNVFRGMVTSEPQGDLIKTPTVNKEAGRVYRRVYTYTLPTPLTFQFADNPVIVPKHCRVIAFVTNSANGAVAQSEQTPLLGQ